MFRLITLGGLSIEDRKTVPGEIRPRLLALLAVLAAAGRKGATRDQLQGILWADSEPERARRSLAQTLYSLRREVGALVTGTTHLKLDPTAATSDVEDFRTAIAEQRWERAAQLFAGPFLDGFFLSDAANFERWVEEERARLTHDAFRAIEAAAREAASGGRVDAAVAHWRRLTTLDPVNGRFASLYIEALVGSGDHTLALVHAEAHATLVRRELEVEPDAAVVAFIESSRAAGVVVPRIRPAPIPAPTTPWAITPTSIVARPRWIGVALVAIVVAIGATQLATRKRGREVASATTSPVAYRLYEDGLRAFYRFDLEEARRLFDAALADDSSFVMAAYFAWRTEQATDGSRQDALAGRALAMATRAPERDRLLIVTDVSAARSELGALATAESLATRYPSDPEALVRAAAVEQDHARARTLLNEAIRLDSANARDGGPEVICRACAALSILADRYDAADSLRGVEQTLARWSALRPGDYQPWRMLAEHQISRGLRSDAEVSLRRADSLGAPRINSSEAALEHALRLDDFAAAEAACRAGLTSRARDAQARWRTLCALTLRMEGRYRDALRLVRDGRTPWSNEAQPTLPLDRVHAATLDIAMGRPASAVVSYLQLAKDDAPVTRAVAWDLTLAATAAALDGDTIRVRALVDSVELIGHRSLDTRDARLHHFLRGLLLAEAGQHEQAVREYQAAMSSPSRGYTRINYEMAKSLIALRRPTEAAGVIRSALRGRLDASSLHLTRTELHEIAARAFDDAGQRDSAVAHYAVVARAWRSADVSLAARYAAARRGAGLE